MRQLYYPRSFYYVTRHGPIELSPKAVDRLRWLKAWRALTQRGLTGQEAAEALRLPRPTLYRWERRLKEERLRGLENRSRRPKRLRPRLWGADLATQVRRLRESCHGWGKDKLAPLLWEDGETVSISTVGRILKHLKGRGLLLEPQRRPVRLGYRPWRRPYAVRKPKGYGIAEPGDMVQVDTVEVRPLPGVVVKQYTARDVVSRWDVVEAHSRATAGTAKGFLRQLIERMPFPVKAIQVDGGSEFQAEFEQACAEQGIRLFAEGAASFSQAEWTCGAGAAHPQGRVLRLLRRSPGPAQPEQGSAPLGAGLQHDPSSPFPWQKDPGAVSSGVLPQLGPGRLTVSYVLNAYSHLTCDDLAHRLLANNRIHADWVPAPPDGRAQRRSRCKSGADPQL